MAAITVSESGKVLTAPDEISAFLKTYGIWFRRWQDIVLDAFREPIEELKREGGYTTADVIDVKPDTPGLDKMLDKFNKEHWHDEDEVRFVVAGRGVFHIHPKEGPVFRIEVRAGDMINVPRGTWHWFDLCDDSRIRCIRLFQDVSGWAPHYTDSGEESQHQPLCFGPSYLPPGMGGA
jgi:1,2-dihydroxy-3-keto-5-methylthiopentene dioxygenase